MSKKVKWKIPVLKSTGEIISSSCRWYAYNYAKTNNNLNFKDPFSFECDLIYKDYWNSPSGIEIHWESELGILDSSMDLLNNLFLMPGQAKSNLKVLRTKPLTIRGKFKFVKRGNAIRIVEDLDE